MSVTLSARRLRPPRARVVPFGLALAAVAGLALYPQLQLPEPAATKGYTSLLNHVAAFVVLTLLARFGWPRSRRVVPAMIGLAVALEVAQFASPGRQVAAVDLAASCAGVALAAALLAGASATRRTWR